MHVIHNFYVAIAVTDFHAMCQLIIVQGTRIRGENSGRDFKDEIVNVKRIENKIFSFSLV